MTSYWTNKTTAAVKKPTNAVFGAAVTACKYSMGYYLHVFAIADSINVKYCIVIHGNNIISLNTVCV